MQINKIRLTLNKECISNTTTIYNTDTCIYKYHNHCWINWTTFNSQHTLTLVKCYKISLKHVTNNTLTLVLADEFIDLLFWWRSTITHVISTKDPSCILSADKSPHSFNSAVALPSDNVMIFLLVSSCLVCIMPDT